MSQIWTVSDSNNRIKRVEKWYSCYWVQREALPEKWKQISNILFRKHDHERVVEWILNSKKSKRSLKIMRFCQDLMISYVEAVVKKLGKFRIICHVRCLQTEVSQKKNRSVENDPVRFGVKVSRIGVWLQNFLYRQ